MRRLRVDSWIGVTRKTKLWWEAWNFQPHPSSSREGRRARDEVNNWGSLHTSKIPRIYGASRWSNTSTSGGWCSPTPQGQSSCARDTLRLHPLHLAVPLYSLSCPLINWQMWVFLWILWDAVANQLKPRRGSLRPSV